MPNVRSPGRTREWCVLSLPHLMHFGHMISGRGTVLLEELIAVFVPIFFPQV
jgi:hypothetical protein